MKLWKMFVSLAGVGAASTIAVATAAAWGGPHAVSAQMAPANAAPAAAAPTAAPPIPPNVETAPVAQGSMYCYGGPHPVDTRHAAGPPWDGAQGRHLHNYPPFDLRLFNLKDGCYHFVGDPQDFGYQGQSYSYYGAHPVHDHHGGGWCFMIGGHSHFWGPFSPHFTVVGPWYYWHGPYDPFFWSYWPYYSFYYRSYYPHYYAGGRYYRGRGGAAPPIRRVPPPTVADGWRGNGRARDGWSGNAAPPTSAGAPGQQGAASGGWGAPARRETVGGGWRGGGSSVGRPWGGGSPGFSAPPPSSGGSSRGGGGSSHGGSSSGSRGGGWRR